MWFQSTFWGLCILPLEFLHKTLRQPTLFLTLANFYRKENFDLLKSQCSSPIIPSYDHMTFHMTFLPQWRAQNKCCIAVHSLALQSSVWPLLLSELWPFLSLPVGEGYKLSHRTGYFLLFLGIMSLHFHKMLYESGDPWRVWCTTHFSLWKHLCAWWDKLLKPDRPHFNFIIQERTARKFIRNSPLGFHRKTIPFHVLAKALIFWSLSFSARLFAFILLYICFHAQLFHNYLCNFQLLIFGLKNFLESFSSVFELLNNFPVLAKQKKTLCNTCA